MAPAMSTHLVSLLVLTVSVSDVPRLAHISPLFVTVEPLNAADVAVEADAGVLTSSMAGSSSATVAMIASRMRFTENPPNVRVRRETPAVVSECDVKFRDRAKLVPRPQTPDFGRPPDPE